MGGGDVGRYFGRSRFGRLPMRRQHLCESLRQPLRMDTHDLQPLLPMFPRCARVPMDAVDLVSCHLSHFGQSFSTTIIFPRKPVIKLIPKIENSTWTAGLGGSVPA